jgi:hypothetical protein
MKRIIFLGLFIVLLIGACTQVKSPIEGVWKITEYSFISVDTSWTNNSPQPSLYIFHKNYYSFIFVSDAKPRSLMPDDATRNSITDEQFRAIFTGMYANSGKYELKGSKLTTRPSVALWPNIMKEGSMIEYECVIEPQTLYLTSNQSTGISKYKLTLLER